MDICNLEFSLKSLNFIDHWFRAVGHLGLLQTSIHIFTTSHQIPTLSVPVFSKTIIDFIIQKSSCLYYAFS